MRVRRDFGTLICCFLLFFPIFAEAFILYTWNLKHLGRTRFRTADVASVIADGDLILIQEVNTDIKGRTKLKELRNAMKEEPGNASKTLCMGISKRPSDGIERYAMIWNQDNIIEVNEKGKETKCNDDDFSELELTDEHSKEIVREPAYVLLKDRASKRLFAAASVHALPNGKGKSPDKEIPLIFESFHSEVKRLQKSVKGLEIGIIGGDFNKAATTRVFDRATELGFLPILKSAPKTSLSSNSRELSKAYDNIFMKVSSKQLVRVNNAKTINLYNQFPDLAQKTIYNDISDHCPIRVDIDMNPPKKK